jgi:hypothetical protein
LADIHNQSKARTWASLSDERFGAPDKFTGRLQSRISGSYSTARPRVLESSHRPTQHTRRTGLASPRSMRQRSAKLGKPSLRSLNSLFGDDTTDLSSNCLPMIPRPLRRIDETSVIVARHHSRRCCHQAPPPLEDSPRTNLRAGKDSPAFSISVSYAKTKAAHLYRQTNHRFRKRSSKHGQVDSVAQSRQLQHC